MSKHRAAYLCLFLALLGLIVFARLGGKNEQPGSSRDIPSGVTSEGLADRVGALPANQAPALETFESWRETYFKASAGERPALEAPGMGLAAARRNLLADMARLDPARAIDNLLSLAELAELPATVRAACEQPFSAIGSIDLRWGTQVGADGTIDCQHQSVAYAGGRSWRVNGPDYLDAKPPRADVPIDGYLIDGELLIGRGAVRQLDQANLSAASKVFPKGNPNGLDPVTGKSAKSDSAALIGGKVFLFENDSVIAQVIARLAEADKQATQTKVSKPDHGFGWLEADGGTFANNNAPPVEATPFLVDTVNVLFIRADFTDKRGEPVTQADLQTSLASVSSSLQNYSYGVASFPPAPTVSTKVYRLGSSTTYTASATGSDDLMAAARSAAAADFTFANYSVVAIYFPALTGKDFNYAGLASVGGVNHWINGLTTNSSRISVMLHEFGHNYGLYHSNYYDPGHQISGGSYLDPAAVSLEYGDVFDRMGSGSDPATGYFGPFSTARLNWMPAGKVALATANGTWRIYRFDAPTALSNPLLGLRVPLGGGENWWVGLRKLFPAIANSAYVISDGIYSNHPTLIDMTPGSQSPEANDRSDAGLPVGSSFYDPAKGVRLRSLASGGISPNEWIDVQVEFDSQLQLATTALEVDEQAGSAVLTMRRTFGSSGVAKVNYTTANGTATAGSDYYAVSGSVTWADGDSADKLVSRKP